MTGSKPTPEELLRMCAKLETAIIAMAEATHAKCDDQESEDAIDRISDLAETFDDIATDDNLLSIARALKEHLSAPPAVGRDELMHELAEAQRALRDAEARGWNDGIERGVKVCEAWRLTYASMLSEDCAQGAAACASSIRALKSSTSPGKPQP